VAAAAKTITQKTGQKGLTQPDDDWYIEQLVASAGENFCTPDNGRQDAAATAISVNTGAAKKAITTVAELYRSGVGMSGAPDGSAALSAFQAGKVGMMFYSSGIAGALKKGTPFKYEALPYPRSGSKEASGPVIGGSALWLSSSAEPAQQVAGWKLATFLTSTAAQEGFSQATGYVPVNDTVATSSTRKAYLEANPNAKVFADQIKNTPVKSQTGGCVTGAMTAIRTATINQMQAAFSGLKPVDAALDQAAADAASAIKQYQQQRGE
jgi:sn-glycerol 3-phosphate transport system substrate-binding protein